MRGALLTLLTCAACGGNDPPPPIAIPPQAPLPTPATSPIATAPCASGEKILADSKPDLPPVPTLPATPRRSGDAYTVFGAVHDLRSRFESKDVTKAEIAIVGYIVDSNIPRAPKCAWHKTGKRDPDECVAEIPSFVIADAKDTKPDDPNLPHIKVLGWARSFAVVFDASAKYKGLKTAPKPLVHDDMWNVDVPFPLPAAGTKVKVKGRYSFAFTKSSTGMVVEPLNGVLTYASLEVVP